jgi:hypothetical protein
MTSYTALELAIEKAQSEKCMIFYQEYENNDYSLSYENFIFYEFISSEDFCEAFYDFCLEKSDANVVCYELWDEINNDSIYLRLDAWKNIHVMNFCDNVDLSEYEEKLIKYFDEKKMSHQ